MVEETYGLIDSIVTLATAVLAVAAIAAAYKAMRRGLTYSATVAVMFLVVCIGVSDLVHLLSESFPALSKLETYEIDHIFSMIGYISFIVLERKSAKLSVPEKK